MPAQQIAALKKELRQKWLQFQAASPNYDCGHSLSKHISVDYDKACRELNAILDQLAEIDPETPTTRF